MERGTYKKRAGTSGIQGQLYETKLISVIYFRMIHDDNVDQFSLATNRDDVGAFDDICFKAKIKGFKKPVSVFIQAKHRENDKHLTFTSEADLAKYFDSYLEIRRAFEPSSKDVIFGGKFDETECIFVMYTTAKDDPSNKKYEGSFADYLNKLIGTGGCYTQPSYTGESLDFLCKIVMKEEITTLAEQLAKFICDESDSVMSMNNDLILRYHVILAHNVLNISVIQPEGHRIASFRQDFFTTNEEFLVLFKNILCLEVLKKRKSEETNIQSLLLKFLSEPSEVTTLSKLIGIVLTYKNSKLEFVGKSMSDDLKRQLDKANVSQSTVYKAAELAAKEYLLTLKLKVPAFFGNKDLAIRGKSEKIEKRLNYLTPKIIEILEKSNSNNIVTINESLGDGFLQLNGGIASAVGNILVFDESSKLLKFTDNYESLGILAKTWYESLRSKIENLHEYKLDVKVKKFPKLSFERGEYDMSLVRDFYEKLLFFTNQADQKGVEKILRGEIEHQHQPCSDVKNFKVRSDVIFLKYHDEIQKLWMTPKVGSYLTKKSKIYENAVSNAMSEPLLGVLSIMHKAKCKNYTFNENALNILNPLYDQIIRPTIIVTENDELTVAKVEQYLGNEDRVVLDLQFIFQLPLEDHNTLCKELTNTTKETTLIIVCRNIDPKNSGERLKNITNAVEGKQIMFVTDKISVDIIAEYFYEYLVSKSSYLINDEKSFFTDLRDESQKKFLATSKIKVQGGNVSLDIIGVDESKLDIVEYVFDKLINNETIEIGDMPIDNNYEKQIYIDRRVSRTKNQEHDKFDDVKNKVLKTFYDLEDNVVLITGEEGMGKSSLLTHLSLKTKELDPTVWIVRINLPEHEGFLRMYFECTNNLDRLKLMYLTALGDEFCKRQEKKDLEEKKTFKFQYLKNGVASLTEFSCSPITFFQFQVFQHYFFFTEKLIFLFDIFDEINISPNWQFEEPVIALRKLVRDISSINKVWVTGRSLDIIEQEFGPSYKLESFSRIEKDTYLNIFWKHKIQLYNLRCARYIESAVDFDFLTKYYLAPKCGENEYLRGYALFLDFLKMETPADGFDFPYDEYYNHFMSGFGLCKLFCFPDDTTPRHLRIVAEYFVEHPLISQGLLRCYQNIF